MLTSKQAKKNTTKPGSTPETKLVLNRTPILRIINNHEDLRNFVQNFYKRIKAKNPSRETFKRERENRRLDALARLLVGDETCAALVFDGEHILIATNENKHEQHSSSADTYLEFEKEIEPGRFLYQLYLEVIIDNAGFKVRSKEKLTFVADPQSRVLKLAFMENRLTFDFSDKLIEANLSPENINVLREMCKFSSFVGMDGYYPLYISKYS